MTFINSAEDLREILKELKGAGLVVKELQEDLHLKNDPASTSLANTGALQGPLQGGDGSTGGAFSLPGVRPDRFSAMPRVRTLASVLRPMPSDYFNEIIGIVTGATASSGSNPTSFCGTAPTPGNMKTCNQHYIWGKYFMRTQLNSVPDIGQLRNRAEVPGRILNSAPVNNPLVPDLLWRLVDTRSQFAYEMYMQGVAMERALEPVLVEGDTSLANTLTETGWISEFAGLSGQVKTGYRDAKTNVLCPAADSNVIDFGAQDIGSVAGGGDGRTITQCVSDLWYAQQDRAGQVKLDTGLEYAFLMRKELFRVLTDHYAWSYASARFPVTAAAVARSIQFADTANKMRIEMLNGQYLTVEGQNIPVVFSDGLPLAGQGNNAYMSDILLVPVDWEGMPMLRLEYFNMANEYIQEWSGFVPSQWRRVLNNGMFMMGFQSTGLCDQYLFAAKMRLILEAPFLAGRIDNVIFTYMANTRNAIPSQSLYVDGGASYYADPSEGWLYGSQLTPTGD